VNEDLSREALAAAKRGAASAFGAPAIWALGFLYGLSAILMRSALGGFGEALDARRDAEMLSCVLLFLAAGGVFLLCAAGMLAGLRRRVIVEGGSPEAAVPRSYWGLAFRLAALAPVFAALIIAVILPGSLLIHRLPTAAIAWTAGAWFLAGCFMFLTPAILAADSSGVWAAVAGAGRFLSAWARFYRVLGIVMLFMLPARAANLAVDALAKAAGASAMNWVLMAVSSLVSGMAVAGMLAALMRFYAALRPRVPA
jgi:hypothetical protein